MGEEEWEEDTSLSLSFSLSLSRLCSFSFLLFLKVASLLKEEDCEKWVLYGNGSRGLHLEDEGEGDKGEMIFHPELFGISFSGGEENRNFISSPKPSNQQHHAHGL